MKHASYEITDFKAMNGDGPKGLFAAMVSVFGNVDKHGDRMLPGAFTKSLDRWKQRNVPVPVIWSHEHKNPSSYIGEVLPQDIKETKDGLVVAGKLDIETNPNAAQVFDLLTKGRVNEWSFGYEVNEDRIAEDLAHELVEVDLIEVGPTLKGANPEVRTLALKEDAQIDNKAWDGAAAMRTCDSAADFRSIAFERANDSDPDTAAHWALPHHPNPGAGADAQGVASALAALNGARGGAPDLKNASAARSHLEAHSTATRAASSLDELLVAFDKDIDVKLGRLISSKTEAKIRSALSALQEILASLEPTEQAGSTPEVKQEPAPPVESEPLHRELEHVGLFLAERNR